MCIQFYLFVVDFLDDFETLVVILKMLTRHNEHVIAYKRDPGFLLLGQLIIMNQFLEISKLVGLYHGSKQ